MQYLHTCIYKKNRAPRAPHIKVNGTVYYSANNSIYTIIVPISSINIKPSISSRANV